MAVILLGLVGYLYFVEFPREKEEKEAEIRAQKVIDLRDEAVRTLTLTYPGQEILLEKTADEEWKLTAPIQAIADDIEVDSILSTIKNMTLTRALKDVSGTSKEFGFEQPQVKVQIGYDGSTEKAQETILLGNDGPIFNTLYVKRSENPPVVLVDKGVKKSLSKTLLDLRDKTVLPMEREKITDIDLAFENQTLLFTKDRDQWWMRKPKSARADNGRIRSLLFTLENLRAKDFTDSEDEKTKIRKEVKAPEVRVALKEGEKPIEISLFRDPKNQEAIAVTLHDKPIYHIEESVFRDFKEDPFYFMDKRLVFFKVDEVKGIKIEKAEEDYELEKVEETWSIVGEKSTVDGPSVTRFLNFVNGAEADQLANPKVTLQETGLNPPAAKIELLDSEGKVFGKILLGNVIEENVYALGPEDLGIVLAEKNALDNIPNKNELIKKNGDKNKSE